MNDFFSFNLPVDEPEQDISAIIQYQLNQMFMRKQELLQVPGFDWRMQSKISEMNLDQIQETLEFIDYDLKVKDEEYEKIHDEMAELRRKLQALDEDRKSVLQAINVDKDDKFTLAQRREHLMRDALKNKAIEETANRIVDIMRDFDGWTKAHDYQREDVVMAVHAYLSGFGGFLNANDMGLGKTMESFLIIRVLQVLFEADQGYSPRILWLTKTSILKTGGTMREGKRWYPDFKMLAIEGSMPKKEREAIFDLVNEFGFSVITNYETVRSTESLNSIDWDIVVMDEVHKLKGGANLSGPTAIWTAVFELTRKTKFMIMLSGTPMVNRVGEMWAYLHIFDPERFPSSRAFERDYTNLQMIAGEMQVVIDGQKLLDKALAGRMCRRRKDEVGLQMPEVTPYRDRERMLKQTPAQEAAYQQMRDQFFIWLAEQDQEKVFSATALIAQLIRLRQINVWPVIDFKKPAIDPFTGMPVIVDGKMVVNIDRLDIRESSKIDEAMDIIEELAGEQVVFFCTFNEPLREIQRRCAEEGIVCKLLTGEHSKDLATLELDFQQGVTQVLCVNSAMGEGLNLQKNPEVWPGGASVVVFLDLWYNPARNDQCTDRVFRQGAHKAVQVIHLKNENSVDQWLDAIIEEKYHAISGIAEDKKLRPGEWAEYLRKLI